MTSNWLFNNKSSLELLTKIFFTSEDTFLFDSGSNEIISSPLLRFSIFVLLPFKEAISVSPEKHCQLKLPLPETHQL